MASEVGLAGVRKVRSSWSIVEDSKHDFRRLLSADRLEIDCPNEWSRQRLHYLDRVRRISWMVKTNFPLPTETVIGEFGCAHGNVSLLLAECGYQVYAVDINPAFIEYSRRKYERGIVEWIVGNIETLNFASDFLDAAIIGEVLSVCADPETILQRVIGFVRRGGLVIVTVPNGKQIRSPWPRPGEVTRVRPRQLDHKQQFSPDEYDNLRSFALEDIMRMLPPNVSIAKTAYCGSTLLINKYSAFLFRRMPIGLVRLFIGLVSKTPLMNQKTCYNICVVLRKN
jgi:2-polyprenyl-3-methyl-5-hydroxy-6-metoxy-1,4-benzoquinol methylase